MGDPWATYGPLMDNRNRFMGGPLVVHGWQKVYSKPHVK